MTFKQCTKCKDVKPLSDFGKTVRHADGLRYQCRVCDHAYCLRYGELHSDRRLESSRQHHANNREKRNAQSINYRVLNRAKYATSPPAMEGEKICPRCQVLKPYVAFGRDSARRDGLKPSCKECCRVWINKEARQVNRTKNADTARESKRQWKRRNPEYLQLENLRRRIGRDVAAVEYSVILRNDPCGYCGAVDDMTIDHIYPLNYDGPNTWDNFSAACRACNSSKHDRPLLAWLASKAFFEACTATEILTA